MVLTVDLKNTTNHAINLGTAGSDLASLHLDVLGPHLQKQGRFGPREDLQAAPISMLAAGQSLFQPTRSSTKLLTLPPSSQRQYRFVLTHLYDLSLTGNYTVQVSRHLPGGSSAISPVLPFRLDSPFDYLDPSAPETRSDQDTEEPYGESF